MVTPYRPRRLALRDGREVTLRAIRASDAPVIERAFARLSSDSRYARFMQHKKSLNPQALDRGVHPVPGRDFAFVATVPREQGIDIVGAAQYVRARTHDPTTCEFAITLAEDWRGSGLARQLMQSLMRRARRDGYTMIEGLVMTRNQPMLKLAHRLGFAVEATADAQATVRIWRALATTARPMHGHPAPFAAAGATGP